MSSVKRTAILTVGIAGIVAKNLAKMLGGFLVKYVILVAIIGVGWAIVSWVNRPKPPGYDAEAALAVEKQDVDECLDRLSGKQNLFQQRAEYKDCMSEKFYEVHRLPWE
jgi:hypothetical protein